MQRALVSDAAAEHPCDLRVLAHDISPPRVTAELASAKLESGIEFEGNPARFVAPVLEVRRARPEEFLAQDGIEPFQTRQKYDRVAPRAGDRHGVELKVAEAQDNGGGGFPGAFPAAFRTLRESGPFGLQQSCSRQRQSPCFAEGQNVRGAIAQ